MCYCLGTVFLKECTVSYNVNTYWALPHPSKCPEESVLVAVHKGGETATVVVDGRTACDSMELELALAEAEHVRIPNGKQTVAVHLNGETWSDRMGRLYQLHPGM